MVGIFEEFNWFRLASCAPLSSHILARPIHKNKTIYRPYFMEFNKIWAEIVLFLWIGRAIMWGLKGTQDASLNQLGSSHRPTTSLFSMKSFAFNSVSVGTSMSASFACFKEMLSSNRYCVKLFILLE